MRDRTPPKYAARGVVAAAGRYGPGGARTKQKRKFFLLSGKVAKWQRQLRL